MLEAELLYWHSMGNRAETNLGTIRDNEKSALQLFNENEIIIALLSQSDAFE